MKNFVSNFQAIGDIVQNERNVNYKLIYTFLIFWRIS